MQSPTPGGRARARGRLAVLLAVSAALSTAAFGQSLGSGSGRKARSSGRAVISAKIHPRVLARAQSESVIPVLIVLTDQPQPEIVRQAESANALYRQIAESRYDQLAQQQFPDAAQLAQARAEEDAVILRTRQQAFQAIGRIIGPEQDALESRLTGLGATRIFRYEGINMLKADLPASAIAELESDPSIAEVFGVEKLEAQLATSVPALGATTFWTAGYTGQGQAVGVLDTGARSNHPAFAGTSLVGQVFLAQGSTDSCFADDASSAEDQNGHGTHVTGIVMSQGSSGWTNYQGVAKGVAALYNLKVGFNLLVSPSCGSGGGESYDSDVLAAIDWAVKNTALKVLNYSYGGTIGTDDDSFSRSIDRYADTYGLTIAVSAGNSGPRSSTVNSPGIAYNVITVANWTSRGAIASSSSRGPTAGGRYKPDLAAPGTSIYSTNYHWDDSAGTGDDFVAMTGTSMAAPHIAGSAAVLRSAGVSNALAVKAILINTTDNTGWAADRGWGYTNLTRAWQELFYGTGSLPASGFSLYRLALSGAFSASVTWNRHVSGSTSNFNDIDLYLFRADTGAQLASSTTSIQNVEQVAANYTGDVVLVVDMASSTLRGVTSEPYAVAFSQSFSSAAGPHISPSCSLPSSIPSGSQFTMTCHATNSGDLPAFSVAGQATLPAGFSGGTQASLGDVQPGGSSSSAGLSLTAPATAGTYSIGFDVSTDSFAETFTGTGSFTATVVAALPAPALSSPPNGASGVSLTPALSWSASSGATSYDVYLGTSSSPPLAANTTGTTYAPGTLSGGTLYYWRVVAKNSTGSSSSTTWSFTTQGSAPPAPTLVSPGNGTTGVSLTPALSWSASSGATSYDVYLGTSSSPPLAANTAGTTYAPGTLSSGTLYYWRVVAKNSTGSSSSTTWSFTTQGSAPPAPTLVSPGNGTTGVSLTPALSWNASSGATSYDVYLGTSSSPPLAANTTGTTYAPGTLSSGTLYYWRVVAKNSTGSSSSTTWSFTTEVSAPPAPTLVSPAGGATGVSLTPVLRWNASNGATSYDVYFGTSLSPPLVANTAGTSYAPGTLDGGTVYYWRVAAKNSSGSSASGTASFTTQAVAPVLLSPGNGAAGVPLTSALSWSASPGAASYDVYFGTSPSPPLAANTAGTSYAPGTLSAGTVYYWRVAARSGGGSYTSATWSFTTVVAPPAAPVLSSPADGAAGVSLAPALTWSASAGAVSYDVYFGTSADPPLAASSGSTSYAPGALSGGTQYYWRVVAKNAGGGSTSATWTFTTQIAAPALAAPGNGAAGVSLTPTLTWNASAGATSYDVYFGTAASPPLAATTSDTSFAPGALAVGTLYFWRVVANGGSGSNASATWSFATPFTLPAPAPLRFVPVAPCRIADTRSAGGPFGGPALVAGSIRAFAVPQSACGIPGTARAYSLNVTALPQGPLAYLTLWPAGLHQPGVSTLNSWGGIVTANGAIVPAGAGGAVNVFVPSATDVILDINGYFDSTGGGNSYSFYPAQPCRVADTRNPDSTFGGPSLAGNTSRDFPIPSSSCGIPSSASAYSLNVTVVPDAEVHYLGYLTTWPAGRSRPNVSTLNSWTGKVVANAALVPAGTGGAISVFASDPTDVILDANGYFGTPGGSGALSFYPVTPCRVADTRGPAGPFGGPILEAGTTRSFSLPAGGCGIPSAAAAYSLNVTVVPDGPLSYLTAWPAGSARPNVSTLNSFDGAVVANAAIVPAGTDKAVSIYVTDPTHVVIDINGYFAP
jgi:subtilisin family serine protease